MTIVDRATRCFLSIQAVLQRSQMVAQQMVDQAPAEQRQQADRTDYESSIPVTYASHVRLQRHFGHHDSRCIACGGLDGIQSAQQVSRYGSSRFCHDQRDRRLPGNGPYVGHVQAKG